MLTPFKPLPHFPLSGRHSKVFFANHYQIRLISMPTLACVCFFFYDDIFSNQGGFPIHTIYFTLKINASSTDKSVLCIDREHILCSEKVESSWKSRFKSNCPSCHCEDVGSKRSFGDTIKEWCSTNMLEVISSSEEAFAPRSARSSCTFPSGFLM